MQKVDGAIDVGIDSGTAFPANVEPAMHTPVGVQTTADAARATGVPFAHFDDCDASQLCLVGQHLGEPIEWPGVQLKVTCLAVIPDLTIGILSNAFQIAQHNRTYLPLNTGIHNALGDGVKELPPSLISLSLQPPFPLGCYLFAATRLPSARLAFGDLFGEVVLLAQKATTAVQCGGAVAVGNGCQIDDAHINGRHAFAGVPSAQGTSQTRWTSHLPSRCTSLTNLRLEISAFGGRARSR